MFQLVGAKQDDAEAAAHVLLADVGPFGGWCSLRFRVYRVYCRVGITPLSDVGLGSKTIIINSCQHLRYGPKYNFIAYSRPRRILLI